MKLKEIYQLVIEFGKDNDPRSKREISQVLARVREDYLSMKADEKSYFDQDRLDNPYSDTRILVGDPQTEVQTVLAGIDMEVSEILLADALRNRGEKIDLIISHHPEGRALAGLYQVMHMQEDMLAEMGVPINVAEGIMGSRINEVQRGLMPANHNRAVDAAKLLGFSFMCVHTPADNMVNTFLANLMKKKKPGTLADIINLLLEIPEYKHAAKMGTGPKIVVGKKQNRAGKIMVDMTGGTSGSKESYAKLAAAGVGTVIGMHIGEEHRKEAEKNHVNVIIAGHMSSDSLGMNLMLDQLELRGVIIKTCSGLYRVSRNSDNDVI